MMNDTLAQTLSAQQFKHRFGVQRETFQQMVKALQPLAQTLSAQQFKHRFGVQRETFQQMVKALQPLWRDKPRPGAKPKLGLGGAGVADAGVLARVSHVLSYWE
jgi:transposase